MERRQLLLGVLAVGAGSLLACSRDEPQAPSVSPSSPTPTAEATTAAPRDPQVVRTLVEGLAVPWGIAFLPDGTALVTQRDMGTVLHVDADGGHRVAGEVPELRAGGEGGLQGIAIDRTDPSIVFTFVTTPQDNRLLRWSFDGERLHDPQVLLSGLTAAGIHHGGALLTDEEGNLFVSIGDASVPEHAQDLGSLHGKTLRLTVDGKAAVGNPRGDRLWTWGHRNVEGLAFDETGRLWASEFGQNEFDEVNLIEAGNNYGWPRVEGKGGGSKYTDPIAVWPPEKASPAGVAVVGGYAWLGGLRGNRLWRVPLPGMRRGKPKAFFVGEYGRLRSVVAAPDGMLWVGTSNRDGRGNPADADDRILVVDPGVDAL